MHAAIRSRKFTTHLSKIKFTYDVLFSVVVASHEYVKKVSFLKMRKNTPICILNFNTTFNVYNIKVGKSLHLYTRMLEM